MSPRARITLLVAAAAAVAAGIAVAVPLLQSDGTAAAPQALPEGDPPLLVDFGGEGAEAADLRRGEELYEAGRAEAARQVFARHDSVAAQVGAAMAAWPEGTVPRLQALARRHPGDAVVRLNLGFALFWSGRGEAALASWRAARQAEPDTPAAVRADDLLHPQFAPGLPLFVPGDGAAGRVRELLLEGVRHQRAGRPLSARAAFERAAEAAPDEPEALVAQAVGRFDKADPAAAFSRLGPLTRRFPDEPTVRFHLGLLLLWSARVDEAREQLERAAALDPDDPLAREAERFLDRLEDDGDA